MELLPFLLVGLLAIGGLVYNHLHRRRKDEAFGRLVTRDPSLTPTALPLGWDGHRLSATCASLPEGDRRRGLEYGVEGPIRTTIASEEVHLDCAAFRWSWEQRRQSQQYNHRYETRRTTVALVRLPVFAPTSVRILPESVLGRLGITGLFALAESCPQLKADRVFADLQRQLIETEDRIAASRRLYNLEIAAYERRRSAIPSNLIAWVLELPPRSLFEIRDPAAAHRQLAAF